MLSIPILIQMGLVSVAVSYAADKCGKANGPTAGNTHRRLNLRQSVMNERCSANVQNISNIVKNSDQRNNALVDSIAAIDRKADNIHNTNRDKIIMVDDSTKILSEALKTHAKDRLERIRQDYGASSGITKDIRKEVTIMEDLLKTMKNQYRETRDKRVPIVGIPEQRIRTNK